MTKRKAIRIKGKTVERVYSKFSNVTFIKFDDGSYLAVEAGREGAYGLFRPKLQLYRSLDALKEEWGADPLGRKKTGWRKLG